jgi:glutathione S-transferase
MRRSASWRGIWAAARTPSATGSLTTADCALVPLLYFVGRSAPLFPGGSPFRPHPYLAAYWDKIARDPVAARVLAEVEAAQTRRAAVRARGEPED